MPAPSQLKIATSSVNRLVKEEASYHKELEQQQASITKLEKGGDDENAEFQLKQEKRALDETKAMFPQLQTRIKEALAKLEQQLQQEKGSSNQTSEEDITKAEEAVSAAKAALKETA